MKCVCLHDKDEIERFLRKDENRNIFCIGDLDDFFWPYTTWYGFQSGGSLSAIALLYTGSLVPILAIYSPQGDGAMIRLLEMMRAILPQRFYVQLDPGLAPVLEVTHSLEPKGALHKMALIDTSTVATADVAGVEPLNSKDAVSMQALFRESYPANWFDPRLLETIQFFGIRENNRLVSVAGVHVYSSRYKVAALGNIATLPEYRKRGLAARVTARLCQSLLNEGILIGLNVMADNAAAVSCYRKLGFKTVTSCQEYLAVIG